MVNVYLRLLMADWLWLLMLIAIAMPFFCGILMVFSMAAFSRRSSSFQKSEEPNLTGVNLPDPASRPIFRLPIGGASLAM